MSFYLGQKVICIDASPSREGILSDLKLNTIYTVIGHYNSICGQAIYLEESLAPPPYEGYIASRFRLLAEIEVLDRLDALRAELARAYLAEVFDHEEVKRINLALLDELARLRTASSGSMENSETKNDRS